MKRDSVVIAGYYGFGNAGDELILFSLIQKIRRSCSEPSITVFSSDPPATAHDFQVSSVHRWKPWHWAWPLLMSERFMLGGGGLLQESTGPWNHFYYLSLLMLAKLFGCQTEVWRIGVDPIRAAFNRFWTRWILNRWADRISVRDEISMQALREAGVRGPISVARDPVFDLAVPTPSASVGGAIAFAVSPWPGRPQWAEELAMLCNRLNEERHIPVDLLVFFPDQDADLAGDLARRSAAIRRVRFWKSPLDLARWIPEYRVVVATRFHALVLAAGSGTEFIGWGAQRKVRAICAGFQKPYWDFSEGWSLEEQIERIVRLYQSTDKSVILATRMD